MSKDANTKTNISTSSVKELLLAHYQRMLANYCGQHADLAGELEKFALRFDAHAAACRKAILRRMRLACAQIGVFTTLINSLNQSAGEMAA